MPDLQLVRTGDISVDAGKVPENIWHQLIALGDKAVIVLPFLGALFLVFGALDKSRPFCEKHFKKTAIVILISKIFFFLLFVAYIFYCALKGKI